MGLAASAVGLRFFCTAFPSCAGGSWQPEDRVLASWSRGLLLVPCDTVPAHDRHVFSCHAKLCDVADSCPAVLWSRGQAQTLESLQNAPLTVGGSLAPTDCGPFGGDCGSGWKI